MLMFDYFSGEGGTAGRGAEPGRTEPHYQSQEDLLRQQHLKQFNFSGREGILLLLSGFYKWECNKKTSAPIGAGKCNFPPS